MTSEDIQSKNDALLSRVEEQITFGTFDPSEQLLQQLVRGLADSRDSIRLRFAETLGEIGEIATPLIVESLAKGSDVVIRQAAAKALTIIADPAAIPALVNAFLHDQDTVVKGLAIGALARIGEAAVADLLNIIASPELPEEIRGQASWALSFIGAEAAELLYEAFNHPSLDVRYAVLGAIGHVAQEQMQQKSCDVLNAAKSCNMLITALTDPEPLLRMKAAVVLGQVKYPAAVPHLILATQDNDLDVKKAAITSLGKLGSRSALAPLHKLLDDRQEVIRVLAKVAIDQINGQASERGFTFAQSDDSP